MLRVEEATLSTFRQLPPDKQERVLDAALAEFAEQGYQAASLNRLVAQAGIAKGSLYQYFPNKEGIFRHIFQFALNQVRRTLTAVNEETVEESLFVRLEKSLLAGVHFLREHPRIFSLYLKIQVDGNLPFRTEFLAAVRRHAAEYFASLVRQAKIRGELRPAVPEAAVLFLLDAVFDRFLQAVAVPALDVTLNLNQAPEEVVRQRIHELVQLLREGLAA
ncbi:MAG: TetR/AcrR family transcriptional regulator [Deltaproteobacteria bacterium]|nr:TetR/AcrR family transcriptional regulator [Deltaproteobacteria bacterium]